MAQDHNDSYEFVQNRTFPISNNLRDKIVNHYTLASVQILKKFLKKSCVSDDL